MSRSLAACRSRGCTFADNTQSTLRRAWQTCQLDRYGARAELLVGKGAQVLDCLEGLRDSSVIRGDNAAHGVHAPGTRGLVGWPSTATAALRAPL
jgi:hypothetical protein